MTYVFNYFHLKLALMVRKRWDQVDKKIEALKGRNIIRVPWMNNLSPLQGSKNIAIATQRSRTGLEEFRPAGAFRAFRIFRFA